MAAGSRAVQARVRLAKRLKEQQAAATAAARCQDGVDAARARAQELAAQGASVVSAAEKELETSIAQLVELMGSAALAAAVLDIDVAVARRAIAAKSAGPTGGPRSLAPRAGNSARVDVADGGPKASSSPITAARPS